MRLILILFLFLVSCTPLSLGIPTRTPTPLPVPTLVATQTNVPTQIVPSPAPAFCVVSDTEGDVLNIRKAPGMDKEIVGSLLPGTTVRVLSWGSEWHKITGGYVSATYCRATNLGDTVDR